MLRGFNEVAAPRPRKRALQLGVGRVIGQASTKSRHPGRENGLDPRRVGARSRDASTKSRHPGRENGAAGGSPGKVKLCFNEVAAPRPRKPSDRGADGTAGRPSFNEVAAPRPRKRDPRSAPRGSHCALQRSRGTPAAKTTKPFDLTINFYMLQRSRGTPAAKTPAAKKATPKPATASTKSRHPGRENRRPDPGSEAPLQASTKSRHPGRENSPRPSSVYTVSSGGFNEVAAPRPRKLGTRSPRSVQFCTELQRSRGTPAAKTDHLMPQGHSVICFNEVAAPRPRKHHLVGGSSGDPAWASTKSRHPGRENGCPAGGWSGEYLVLQRSRGTPAAKTTTCLNLFIASSALLQRSRGTPAAKTISRSPGRHATKSLQRSRGTPAAKTWWRHNHTPDR